MVELAKTMVELAYEEQEEDKESRVNITREIAERALEEAGGPKRDRPIGFSGECSATG